MRQRLKWLLVLIGGLLIFGWSAAVQARSYDITDYDMAIDVAKDGSAAVTQKVRYDFDGDFNGVYYNQDTAGIDGMTALSVAVQSSSGVKALTASNTEAPGTYTTTDSNNRRQIKVFYPVSDDTVTFLYRYRLNGVVTNYRDTAELNWKVIGTGWDVPLNNVKVTIQLPQKNVRQLQAWTHGPLSGNTKVERKAGRVVITLDKNPANTFVESHMLFPTAVTADNAKTSDKNRKKAVQQQEADFAKEANAVRRRAQLIPSLIAFASLILGGIVLVTQLFWLRKHPAERYPEPAPIKHWYDIPEYPPAVAQRLVNAFGPNKKAFTATLMDLAVAKKITITATKVGNKDTFALAPTDKFTNPERVFKLLFETVPRRNRDEGVTLVDIKNYGRTDKSGRLSKAYEDWEMRVRGAVDELHYENTINGQIRNRAWVIAVASTVFAAGASVAALFTFPSVRVPLWGLSVLLVLAGWILLLVKTHALPRYTQLGAQKINEVRGFKQMLEDVGHFDMAQVGDLILWDRILPYAVAFGSADKVVAALKMNFSEEQLATSMPINYPLFIYGYGGFGGQADFGEAFTSGFGSSLAASHSASSNVGGGSGGFSGGNSGGFGGGSGGGAF
ncbi:hypothetical protein ATO00_01825 [Loigolactobacillus coryniformis subsp. coryniformis]|uniref:Integral membrane protein n=1 Tax=Loigolactobacillus coryniformis subsp. coryniformis KCTC 3167 = DSM 20001 TaxID=913848 RepID=A0A0R1F8Q1_9LACO|nr:DUF2207 domain-containing protein [Loigolactobacillus coryniformis]ATO56408.1 hypothetical protein LC20001_12605 [Loigolactobacillus coryniformis subsp. coryniformis KCTC 3167 = DSM 20001]KRK15650.1 integral membrane protein [Loigolactobacillus coryniformis subsp. coryniformis KCTC 3167 = DSM 20001]OEH90787.1 hypothetical protein ATO00_01825 [Loigolactobacillus coryniformis subsp. coryniformis]